MNNTINLSDIQGFERLFVSLNQRKDMKPERLAELLYGGYLANIAEYQAETGEHIDAVDKESFQHRMLNSDAKPYRTDIQLCKAMDVLEWNLSALSKQTYSDSVRYLSEYHKVVDSNFHFRTNHQPKSPFTSFALCEDSLNPRWEPAHDFNPAAMQKLEDSHPRMVYICAPLRGNVEQNIEFARQKAQAVFADGDIPICPHLIFPPVADPADPIQDKAAMEMCLKLIERCHQINVYGPEWTEGMWIEIHHAEHMKIPVYTDQKTLGKTEKHYRRDPSR